jgi:hypothetical protein
VNQNVFQRNIDADGYGECYLDSMNLVPQEKVHYMYNSFIQFLVWSFTKRDT